VSFGFIRAEDVLMKKQTWNSHSFSFRVSVHGPKQEYRSTPDENALSSFGHGGHVSRFEHGWATE
jgi:hypothetical protein